MSITEMIKQVEELPADAQALVVDFIEMLQRVYARPQTEYRRDEQLRRYFGIINTGTPSGSDNDLIDDDLSR